MHEGRFDRHSRFSKRPAKDGKEVWKPEKPVLKRQLLAEKRIMLRKGDGKRRAKDGKCPGKTRKIRRKKQLLVRKPALPTRN
jgi:hypothetical protein